MKLGKTGACLFLNPGGASMVLLNVLNKSNGISKSFAAFRAYINWQLPYTAAVITSFMNFFDMLHERCNWWKPHVTLWAHFLASRSTSVHATITALPHLKCLVKITTQLCHACFSWGSGRWSSTNKSGPCWWFWLDWLIGPWHFFSTSGVQETHEWESSVGFWGSRTLVIGSKSMFQTMIYFTILAFDSIGEHEGFLTACNRAFPLLGYFLVIFWVAGGVDMRFPSDVWVFIWYQANSFGTKWAYHDSDTFVVTMWTLMLLVASMLKAKYLYENQHFVDQRVLWQISSLDTKSPMYNGQFTMKSTKLGIRV